MSDEVAWQILLATSQVIGCLSSQETRALNTFDDVARPSNICPALTGGT